MSDVGRKADNRAEMNLRRALPPHARRVRTYCFKMFDLFARKYRTANRKPRLQRPKASIAS